MRETKRIYIQLVETYIKFGYDISDMFHPVYKNLSIEGMKAVIQRLHDQHGEINEYE